MDGVRTMWTVYKHPSDYPNDFVARKFAVDADGPRPLHDIIIAPKLDDLQDVLQFELHLTKLMRSPEDEPQIVETWI